MVYGRIIGTFIAVVLSYYLRAENSILIQFGLWVIATIIGFASGVFVSLLLGMNINTDQPNEKDGLDYWTTKYGDEMGKESYKMWLEELDKVD